MSRAEALRAVAEVVARIEDRVARARAVLPLGERERVRARFTRNPEIVVGPCELRRLYMALTDHVADAREYAGDGLTVVCTGIYRRCSGCGAGEAAWRHVEGPGDVDPHGELVVEFRVSGRGVAADIRVGLSLDASVDRDAGTVVAGLRLGWVEVRA